MRRWIRIGTRGSPLALAQTELAARQLKANIPELRIKTRVIKTEGDRLQDRPLRVAGGKGLFTSELEAALLDGAVDAAVHSMKDLPSEMDERLLFAAVPKRGNPFDALVLKRGDALSDLPDGAVVGTGSVRRAAQLRAVRPDLRIEPIRGNVDTRLRKLREGAFDALIVAAAGLERLGLSDRIAEILKPPATLPAAGQGLLCLQARRGDRQTLETLQTIHHIPSARRAQAERAFLRRLGGGCGAPIAAYAVCAGENECGAIALTGRVLSRDGSERAEARREGSDPAAVGAALAEQLLAQGAKRLLA